MSVQTAKFKDPTRKTALIAGLLYLATFASSIPAVFMLGPALTNPDYITGAGPDGLVRLGSLLDLVNCFTAVGTAVALFSVAKRYHEGLALGFVASRLTEAAILFVATLAILSVVTLRETAVVETDPATLVTVGQSLVAVRDWAFQIGTGVPALNALILGTLMYRSRLVPRAIPALGLIGVVTFGSAVIAYILGLTSGGSAWMGIGVAPIFIWELSLGLWMTFKGFRRSAVEALYGVQPRDQAQVATTTAAGIAAKAGVA